MPPAFFKIYIFSIFCRINNLIPCCRLAGISNAALCLFKTNRWLYIKFHLCPPQPSNHFWTLYFSMFSYFLADAFLHIDLVSKDWVTFQDLILALISPSLSTCPSTRAASSATILTDLPTYNS